MRHLHDELLAGLALGEPDRLRAGERAHLLVCRYCAGRLAELRALVTIGRFGEPGPLRAPRPGLLAAIQAEVAADPQPPSAASSSVHGSSLVSPAGSRARYGRRLVAAAAILAVALGGTFWYRSTEAEQIVARATLSALPDKSGQGTAELTNRAGAQQLSINVTAPIPADAYEELWLINTDGKRMISLGVVPADGRATYVVPLSTGALDGYTVVDISLEPYDGNAAHSRNSVLRGTLG